MTDDSNNTDETTQNQSTGVFTLPREHPMAGMEVRQQTWNDLAEELKSRLEKQMASGDHQAAKNAHDLYVLLHIALGMGEQVAKDHVVLTASGEKKTKIEELRKQLAAAEAA